MTIFSQKRPKYGEDPNFTPNTVIGEGVTLMGGMIKGANSVMINGLVFGDINVDGEVIVSDTGYVKGDIVSTFAVIAGIVEGNINLTSYCSLKSSASVTGDIRCTAINIEDGAVFTGACNMVVKSGSLAKKLRKINEQAAAIEAMQPGRLTEPNELISEIISEEPDLLEPDGVLRETKDEPDNIFDKTDESAEWYSLEDELKEAEYDEDPVEQLNLTPSSDEEDAAEEYALPEDKAAKKK